MTLLVLQYSSSSKALTLLPCLTVPYRWLWRCACEGWQNFLLLIPAYRDQKTFCYGFQGGDFEHRVMLAFVLKDEGCYFHTNIDVDAQWKIGGGIIRGIIHKSVRG